MATTQLCLILALAHNLMAKDRIARTSAERADLVKGLRVASRDQPP